MKRSLWLLLAAGLLAGPSKAQVPNAPANTGPEFRTVQAVDPNNQIVVFLQYKLVNQTIARPVTEKAIINGQEVTVTKTVNETVAVQVPINVVWSAKKDKAYDGAGFPLPVEKVMQLKQGDAVIVTHNQKLDPAFERLLNKKAVVLLIVGQK